ncbi:MAG: HutP family protein [Firmicutes bacterium]|nr:HutP family protein [Bacillota bacterium]
MKGEEHMYDSTDVAKAAIRVAITSSRAEEERLILKLKEKGVQAVAVDVGGDIVNSVHVMIERALIASRKSGLSRGDSHLDDGAIAGAAREAVNQIAVKTIGLNGGGKIAVCRYKEHLSVCVFMSIGLMHLNEVVIGLGHRSIPAQ